ncbi:sulfatase-like hydrolase/transferase [Helicobacter himalayensis]|uniref:sulfatase-like hydrolase/transferase n=1 Tax=Helicobacter himalayensis TaxID=1591088 RepID=UPI003D6DE4B3
MLANFKALEGGNTTLYASTNKVKTPPLVILIIGESTQRNYLNLYGYPLPTTPKLNALRDSQNLFVFSDVISPATHTDESLRKVLTFSNYENEQIPWYKQMNIIDTMKMLVLKHFGLAIKSLSQFMEIPRRQSLSAQIILPILLGQILIPLARSKMKRF